MPGEKTLAAYTRGQGDFSQIVKPFVEAELERLRIDTEARLRHAKRAQRIQRVLSLFTRSPIAELPSMPDPNGATALDYLNMRPQLVNQKQNIMPAEITTEAVDTATSYVQVMREIEAVI